VSEVNMDKERERIAAELKSKGAGELELAAFKYGWDRCNNALGPLVRQLLKQVGAKNKGRRQ